MTKAIKPCLTPVWTAVGAGVFVAVGSGVAVGARVAVGEGSKVAVCVGAAVGGGSVMASAGAGAARDEAQADGMNEHNMARVVITCQVVFILGPENELVIWFM